MKLFILILLVLNSTLLFCQTDRDEVLSTAGGTSSEKGFSVSWTVGEAIINQFSIPGYTLSQGFQKGYLSVVTQSQNLPDEINITAYPNPVLNSLTIKIVNSSGPAHWSVNVYDYKGEVAIQQETEKDLTEVNLSSLPPGAYLVKIAHQAGFKIFNIIKQ
jgi:hypothetical protein